MEIGEDNNERRNVRGVKTVVASTYESQNRDAQRNRSMQQVGHAQDLHIHSTDLEIPHEVPGPERLHHASQPRVTPHPLLPRSAPPLPIREKHVERGDGHERGVDKRSHVDVPLQLCAS